MAAGNWIVFDSAKASIGNGTMDLDSHVLKCMLTTASYTPNRATQTVKADVTNELAAANGYVAGGLALSGVVFTQTAGVAKLDANDIIWSATPGALTARIAVIYDDTVASPVKPLICYCILDTADVTAPAGQNFAIILSASGILNLSGATS